MQDVRNQRLTVIRQADRHTYDAIRWLQDNQHRFKQPILEPIMLVVSEVPNTNLTHLVTGGMYMYC